MKTIQEALYLRSPAVVQNCLVSLKGLQLERERRRGIYREMRDRLTTRRQWGEERFISHQRSALARLLRAAARHVPWYRERLGPLPSSERILEEWHRIPLLSKEAVRRAPGDFVDQRIARGGLITLHTTGSTGTPLRIYSNLEARRINYAYFDDYLDSVGIDPTARRAVIAGRVVIAQEQRKPPFWRHSLFQNALYLSAYHLGPATATAYLRALERFRPRFIEGYPSALYTLAHHLGPGAGAGLRLSGVITSSETLDPLQREVIETAFGCPVFDQYGSAEMAQFVGQCAFGRYHVRPDYGLLEILDAQGRPAPPGEEGEIVCTGLINSVMPLIRYPLGDRGAFAADRCDCGLKTPLLQFVSGRRDDLIRTPDGREIGRLSPVLKGFPVREAQYVQRWPDEVEVKVVPSEPLDRATREAIAAELRKRIGEGITIRVIEVAAIPRGAGGKFRAVISEVAARRAGGV